MTGVTSALNGSDTQGASFAKLLSAAGRDERRGTIQRKAGRCVLESYFCELKIDAEVVYVPDYYSVEY